MENFLGEMENEFMQRGYLLPEGCKDLNDVLKLKASDPFAFLPQQSEDQLPPVVGEKTIREPMTVPEIAALIQVKPFEIIADLLDFGVYATVNLPIGFTLISRILRKHGFIGKPV